MNYTLNFSGASVFSVNHTISPDSLLKNNFPKRKRIFKFLYLFCRWSPGSRTEGQNWSGTWRSCARTSSARAPSCRSTPTRPSWPPTTSSRWRPPRPWRPWPAHETSRPASCRTFRPPWQLRQQRQLLTSLLQEPEVGTVWCHRRSSPR